MDLQRLEPFGFELFPEIIPLFQGIPSEAGEFLLDIWDDSLFWSDFWVTLQEALLVLFLARFGIYRRITAWEFQKVAKVLAPFLIFTNAVPKIALAPILILWYGVDIASKVALATIIVFFIVQIPVQQL